jgi:hypothetical protein
MSSAIRGGGNTGASIDTHIADVVPKETYHGPPWFVL